MANEFLISKWKIWYKTLDVNKDGVLSNKDAAKMKEHFEKLQGKELGETIEKWWDELIFQGRDIEVNITEFVELLEKQYVTDKDKFRGKITKLFGIIWDALDTDGDGNCSETEFISAFQTFGIKNEDVLKKLFAEHNPVDGQVPMDKVKGEWVDFIVNDDTAKGSRILQGFQTGGDS